MRRSDSQYWDITFSAALSNDFDGPTPGRSSLSAEARLRLFRLFFASRTLSLLLVSTVSDWEELGLLREHSVDGVTRRVILSEAESLFSGQPNPASESVSSASAFIEATDC